MNIKKKRNVCLVICLMFLLMPFKAYAVETHEETELTIHYEGGKNQFHFYKVASFVVPDQYDVEEKFEVYEGKVTGIDRLGKLTTEEIKMLAETLRSLTFTDRIEPDKTMETEEGGIMIWEDIPKGYYLIVGEKSTDEEYVYTPMPVLLSIPYEYDNGEWKDDVEILHNKTEKRSLEEAIDIPVVMVWRNNGSDDVQPEDSNVELYQGSEVYEEETFDEESGWNYTWIDLPPEEEWNVEESELPEGYTYSYVPKGDGILIINTYELELDLPMDETLPQTGQLWWPVPILLIWGASFYLTGWIIDKKMLRSKGLFL